MPKQKPKYYVTDETAKVWGEWLDEDDKPKKATVRQMVRELLHYRKLDKELIKKLVDTIQNPQIILDF